MKYKELIRERNEEVEERLEVVLERIHEIVSNPEVEAPFDAYFKEVADYFTTLEIVLAKAENNSITEMTAEEGKEINEKLFHSVLKENYETSFANPSYAVKTLGKEYGQLLSAIYAKTRSKVTYAFEGNKTMICIFAELFVEAHTVFSNPDELSAKNLQEMLYSFEHDYADIFGEDRVNRIVNPDCDYFRDIVMNSDLSDIRYLYQYGLYVSDNERKIAEFFSSMPEEEIQAMADTFTEGYRIGFETTRKDLSKKESAQIRYPIGFERMAKAAVLNFEKLNLKSMMAPFSTDANKQYAYDHKEDQALYLDKAMVERTLEVYRTELEKKKQQAGVFGGPAVIDVFGEEPFSPEQKEETLKLSEKQQQLSVYSQSEFGQLLNQYIKGEERSFTIIAYPLPSIGDKFEEIFAETVKLNNLDYKLYQTMQQNIINVLDTADRVHILGGNGNKTDLYVKICPLADPSTQSAFENCVADVNIPVGEVFTSPVLKGTTGKLHVSQVYLNELNYKNLEIDFVDGMIADYGCTNFESKEEGRKYIQDNVLFHHETLPMGEFAIGTNTVAYVMARVYDIADKLPILIAEKTGPHFAVGDTCYSFSEDTPQFNPDGKEVIARDNEVSVLRKTDMSKAYFNCHTDITIPYDELDKITAIDYEGNEIDIISGGRFVVPGTELLNQPLDEFEK